MSTATIEYMSRIVSIQSVLSDLHPGERRGEDFDEWFQPNVGESGDSSSLHLTVSAIERPSVC